MQDSIWVWLFVSHDLITSFRGMDIQCNERQLFNTSRTKTYHVWIYSRDSICQKHTKWLVWFLVNPAKYVFVVNVMKIYARALFRILQLLRHELLAKFYSHCISNHILLAHTFYCWCLRHLATPKVWRKYFFIWLAFCVKPPANVKHLPPTASLTYH